MSAVLTTAEHARRRRVWLERVLEVERVQQEAVARLPRFFAVYGTDYGAFRAPEHVNAYDIAGTIAIDWRCPEPACCALPGEPCKILDGHRNRGRTRYHILRRGACVEWLEGKPGAPAPDVTAPRLAPTAEVYALHDPRDGAIRYVGRSVAAFSRFRQHVTDYGQTPKGRWVGELRAVGLEPWVEVLEAVPLEQADEAEMRWIAHGIADGWPLTNVVGRPKRRKAA